MKKLLLLFVLLFTASANFSQVSIVSQTNVSCPGMCDGGVTFSTSVPGPYTVNWGCSTTTTSVFPSSPIIFTGLCACPAYNFVFSNSGGFIGINNVTISTPAPMNCIFTKTNVCCFGNCTGALMANLFGGTAPYTYTWVPFGVGFPTAPNLCAGNYTLLIKDSKLCTASFTSNVTQPAPLTVSVTKTLTSSSSSCDGQINGMASGGTAPYTYTLSPGGLTNSTGTFTSLCNGTYTLCTKDNGCCITCNTVAITTATVLGVQNNSLTTSFEMYPNPASEKIIFKTALKDVFVEMIDSRGKVVKQERLIDNSLNVSDVSEGIYILNIKSGEATLRKQIVIAR